MAATLDAGPSASLAMENRHTGCAQNLSQTSDAACLVESSVCGATNGLPHRAAWTATSPFLNGSEQIPQVVTSSCSVILAASVLMIPMLDLRVQLPPGSPHEICTKSPSP
jgi:hypothetical protein